MFCRKKNRELHLLCSALGNKEYSSGVIFISVSQEVCLSCQSPYDSSLDSICFLRYSWETQIRENSHHRIKGETQVYYRNRISLSFLRFHYDYFVRDVVSLKHGFRQNLSRSVSPSHYLHLLVNCTCSPSCSLAINSAGLSVRIHALLSCMKCMKESSSVVDSFSETKGRQKARRGRRQQQRRS